MSDPLVEEAIILMTRAHKSYGIAPNCSVSPCTSCRLVAIVERAVNRALTAEGILAIVQLADPDRVVVVESALARAENAEAELAQVHAELEAAANSALERSR